MGRAWASKSGTGTKHTLPAFLNFGAWTDYMLYALIPLLLLLYLTSFQA